MSRKSLLILIHLSIWILGFIAIKIYDFLAVSYFDYREYTYFSLVFGTIINALIFYGNSQFLLPKTLKKKLNLSSYILLLILSVTLLSFIEGFTDFLFNKLFNPYWDNINTELSIEYFDFTLFINLLFLIVSFGYGFTLQCYSNEIQKRKLIQDNIQTELNMLKTQIKPHFLFNTLNNIFGIAQKNKESAVANSISKLADIMRYLTYESKDGKVQIIKEIEYLENFIELQKLRFSDDDRIKIEFSANGNFENVFIEQLILLPLVENAFKHGISLQNESEINIQLRIENKILNFHVQNTINPVKNKLTTNESGVGLENLENRLGLLYPEKHKLVKQENAKYFEVFLTLEL